MNAGEFKEVAEFLMKKSTAGAFKEGAYRTSISRLYYYIFLEIRDTILFSDARTGMRNKLRGGKTHRLVQEYLRKVGHIIDNEDLKDAAELLYSLHELRKDADYETGKLVRKEDVERALAYAEEIKEIINELEYNGISGNLENVLTYLKINGQLPQV